MTEKIFDVFWEGPFNWEEYEEKIENGHVIYAVYGFHPVYGHEALLYIGKTRNIRNRIATHAGWVEGEYEEVSIRLASMGRIRSWNKWDDFDRYPKAHDRDVSGAETLLINAHQPAYNQTSKDSMRSARGIRIFNTGRSGSLLPEVSYRYHNSRGEW
jgi:hypothetical protein